MNAVSFLEYITVETDRFRRVINSDQYLPRICRDLAERCEGMLGHLKSNIVYIPQVNVIEKDFSPVLEQCRKIADFLEETQNLSWTQRKFTFKKDIVEKAKVFTLKVDEINCQIIIQLNAYSTRERMSSDDEDYPEIKDNDHRKDTIIDNISRHHDMLIGAIGMLVFVGVALYIHFSYPH